MRLQTHPDSTVFQTLGCDLQWGTNHTAPGTHTHTRVETKTQFYQRILNLGETHGISYSIFQCLLWSTNVIVWLSNKLLHATGKIILCRMFQQILEAWPFCFVHISIEGRWWGQLEGSSQVAQDSVGYSHLGGGGAGFLDTEGAQVPRLLDSRWNPGSPPHQSMKEKREAHTLGNFMDALPSLHTGVIWRSVLVTSFHIHLSLFTLLTPSELRWNFGCL